MDNAGQWSEAVLQLAMVNTMDQWVEESTRYKREEEPSLLDLVFTKKPEPPPSMQYLTPVGRSDHVTLEMEIQEEDGISYRDDYKRERLNYARPDFEKLRNFVADIEWRNIMYKRTIQRKCKIFLQKYIEGVKKCVSFYRVNPFALEVRKHALRSIRAACTRQDLKL
ncbi:hypothetical protein E2C01_102869 [Portunus trituberculatus]|uniref:Endonuclease/exonuclease/phosphatase domain-containing protein n=1 Tax=Portunus trituberculatus TaxID=210409 RepID=A0A5B7KJK0_PORTR|nr:hypothetical protein [Portunus trituberculatus]